MPILGSSPAAVVPVLPGRLVTAAPDATPGPGLATPPLPAGIAPYCFILGQVGGAVTSRVFTVATGAQTTQQGDTLLITFNIASAAMTISAVNDSAGNTYVLDSNSTTTAPQQRNYRALNASPMGPGSTVTVTTSATNANLTMSGLCVPCAAWEGVPDVIGPVANLSAQTSMSQSITPSADGELIIFSNVNQSIGGPNYTDPPFFGQWFNTYVPGTNEVTWSYLACGAGTAGVAQTCTVRFGQSNNARMGGWAFLPAQAANGFEAGTSGNVLATALAASGETAWDYTVQGSGATAQYDSAHAHNGSLSAQIATTTSAQAFAGWTTSLIGVQPELWARLYVYMTAAPTVNSRLLTFYGKPWDTTTYNGFLRLNTGGKLALCDAGSTQRWVSAAALPLNQWCRVEFYVHGDAVGGQLEARLWTTNPEASAATPDDGSGLLATFGTFGQIGGVAFGVGASGSTAGPYWLDDCAVSTGAWRGPAAPPAAVPVAQADTAGAADTLVVAKVWNNDAEGGTNGTAVTTANAGGAGDTLFNAVTGTAITFDNTHVAHGTLAFKADYTTSAQNHLDWTGVPSGRVWYRMYLYYTANPGSFGSYVIGTAASNASVRVNSTGTLSVGVGDHVSGQVMDLTTTTHIPLNQWFRIEGYFDNGACELQLFTGADDASPAETQTKASAAQNYSGTTILFGGRSSTIDLNANTFWFDDIGLSSSGYLGPAAGPTPVALADTAGAAEALAATATTPLADTAGAAEALSVAATASLADVAGAADALAVTVTLPLADTAGAADTVAVPSRTIPLAETAGAADAAPVTAETIPLADTAAAVEALSVSAPPTVPTQVATGLTTGAGTSRTATVTQATGAGDTLLALVSTQATGCTISALTDSKGNVYTLDRSYAGAVPLFYAFRSPGQTGGPGGGPTAALAVNDTVTATSTAITGNVEIQLIDVPGVGPVDQIGVLTNSVGATQTASATPAQNGEMCVALQVNANSGGAPTVGSPFTLIATYHTGVNVYNTASYQQLGAGSGAGSAQNYSATTAVSSGYSAMVYTFTPINKLETLTDAFPGSSVDTTKWSAYNNVSVGGGVLTEVSTANSTTAAIIVSNNYYDLTGSYFQAQLLSTGMAPSTDSLIKVQRDANNSCQLLVSNNTIAAQVQTAGSWGGALGQIAYNASTMRFLRIRESGGTLYFDYSPDCLVWTNLYSLANPWPVTAMQASVQCGAYATTDPAVTAKWDNVNILTGGYPVLWPETAAAAEAVAIAAAIPLIEPDQAAAVEQFAGIPPASILPRCHRSGDSAAATTTNVSPNYASMTNSGQGLSGTAPVVGDLVILVVNAHLANITMSQTADTAGVNNWQLLNGSAGDNNGGAVGQTTIIAYRWWTGAEGAPAWTLSSACRVAFSTMVFGPATAGQNINIDSVVGMVTDQGSTTHTPPSVSAGLAGEMSLVVGGATGSTGGTSPLTYANGAWTILGSRNNTGAGGSGPGSQSFGTFIGFQAGIGPGMINPDTWTIEGSSSATGNTNVNFYHLILTAAPVPNFTYTNSFDGGTSLANITPANSYPGPLGLDTGFQAVVAGGNGSVAYDTITTPAFGKCSAHIHNGTTAGMSYMGWGQQFGASPPMGGPAANTQVWFRFYYFQTAATTANTRIFQLSAQGDPNYDQGNACIFLRATSANKLAIIDSAGTVVYTTTASLPVNTWCRIEGWVIGDPTNGGIQVGLYPTASPTVAGEVFNAATGQATGGKIGFIEFGGPVSASGVDFNVDEVGVSNVGFVGQVVPPYADRAAAVESFSWVQSAAAADVAAATDAFALTGQTIALADQAAAIDSLAVTVTLPLADTAAGIEAVALPAKTLPVPDTAGAAEALTAAVTLAVPDQAAGVEALAVAVAVPLPEVAAGTEALALPAKTLALADTAGAVDACAVTNIGIALAEVAGGSDVLSVGGTSTPALAEQAAAVEALAATVTLPLGDSAGAAEAAAIAAAVPVAEAAGAIDAEAVAAAVPLPDSAGAVEFTPQALADAAGAAEALAITATTPLADTAGASEAFSTVQGSQVAQAEAAGAADVLAATGQAPHLVETAAGTETVVPAAALAVADAAAGVEAFTFTSAQQVALADAAAAADAEVVAGHITNSFETGTSGTTLTTGNTGSVADTAFDSVAYTAGSGDALAFDNSTAAHGGLSLLVTTGAAPATEYVQWDASFGTARQAFWRMYINVPANPGSVLTLATFLSSGTICARLLLSPTGLLSVSDSTGAIVLNSGITVPLGSWFRVEGYVLGDSQHNGGLELKTFTAMDSQTAADTQTAATGQSTFGFINQVRIGCTTSRANITLHLDEIGIAADGYLGPVFTPQLADAAGAAESFLMQQGTIVTLADFAAATGEESGQILVPEPVSPAAPFGGTYVTSVLYNGHGVLREGPGFQYNSGPGYPGCPIVPGATYHFQVAMLPVPGDPSSNGTAQIQWLDAGSNSIGTVSNTMPGGLSGWQLIDVWGVAPANARFCYVQFWYDPVDHSQNWWVGQAQLSAFAGLGVQAAVPLPEAGTGLDAFLLTGLEHEGDTASLADAGEGIRIIPQPETGQAAEASTIHATLSDTDRAVGADSDGSVPGRPRDYDTGHFEDSEIKPVAAFPETFTAADEAVSIRVIDSDRGSASEDAGFTGQVFVSDSDSGTAQDDGAGQGDRGDTDTGTGTDDQRVRFAATETDAITAADDLAELQVFTFWPATLHVVAGQQFMVVWARDTPEQVTLMSGRLDKAMLVYATALHEHAAQGGTLKQVSDGDSISISEGEALGTTVEVRGWLGAGGTQVVGRARAWDGSQWVTPELVLRGPEGDTERVETSDRHPRLGFVLVTAAARPGRWEVIAVAFGLKVAYALVVQHVPNPIPLP